MEPAKNGSWQKQMEGSESKLPNITFFCILSTANMKRKFISLFRFVGFRTFTQVFNKRSRTRIKKKKMQLHNLKFGKMFPFETVRSTTSDCGLTSDSIHRLLLVALNRSFHLVNVFIKKHLDRKDRKVTIPSDSILVSTLTLILRIAIIVAERIRSYPQNTF